MHGVRRQKLTAEAQAVKHARDQKKIEHYNGLVDAVFSVRSAGSLDIASLSKTRDVLKINPEFYTVWNCRREQISAHLSEQVLVDELSFVQECLLLFPKCYWIWNQRVWVLEAQETPNWSKELSLVGKLLARDGRNFHGWHYRRMVIAKLETIHGSMTADEFDYTTAAIKKDFSNFSAWHNRTKLIPKYLNENTSIDRRNFMNGELEMLRQAMYTDPDDQSIWFYHRWVLTAGQIITLSVEDLTVLLKAEIEAIMELTEIEPDSKCDLHLYSLLITGCLHSLFYYRKYLAEVSDTKPGVNIMDYIDRLKTIDPMRRNRYCDFEEALHMESKENQ